jgi:hypothetical protein
MSLRILKSAQSENRLVVPALREFEGVRQIVALRMDASAPPKSLEKYVLRGILPAVHNQSANCSGCQTCSNVLGVAAVVGSIAAPVVIADTGVRQSLGVPQTQLFHLEAEDPLAWPEDLADNAHGSFIYSQLSVRHAGILPDRTIYVARVARRDKSQSLYYDVQATSRPLKNPGLIGNGKWERANC